MNSQCRRSEQWGKRKAPTAAAVANTAQLAVQLRSVEGFLQIMTVTLHTS